MLRKDILFNFEMEVKDILKTKTFELTDEKNIPVIKNWLGSEGLQLIKTFTNEEKGKCKIGKGPFLLLIQKFKPHHNTILLSMQYYKLMRMSHESA